MSLNPVKQKAFKVVRVLEDGRRISCLFELKNIPKYCVEYREGQIVRPNYGKLFVFTTLPMAMSHAVDTYHKEIWEVEAYGASKTPNDVVQIWGRNGERQADTFWERLAKNEPYDDLLLAPSLSYSCVCKSLKMVRRVREIKTPY